MSCILTPFSGLEASAIWLLPIYNATCPSFHKMSPGCNVTLPYFTTLNILFFDAAFDLYEEVVHAQPLSNNSISHVFL